MTETIKDHPAYADIVATLQSAHNLYGDAGIETIIGDIDGYPAGAPPVEELWGEPWSDGSRGHPDIDAFRATITDITLLERIPEAVICKTGQPATGSDADKAQRAANIAKYDEMYWSSQVWGQIKVDEQGRHLPIDLYAGKPVQDDYFWKIAPCTQCYVWDTPSDAPSTWKSPLTPTNSRVVENLASFLEIARVYKAEWEAGNRS